LPDLNPWVLDFAPEFRNQRYLEKSSISSSVAPPVQAPMVQQQSRLISSDFSAEFKVPGSINLNSGSDKRRFSLNTKKMNSTIKLASSPRFDPRAMLVATANYEEETPLLAGSLSLYRNGNFVGNSFLDQKLSGEEINISFGEDDKVKIKFLPDPDKKRKDGLLFGKKKVVERHYKVSVSSNHNKPFPITLSDVLPVSSDENIKIKALGDVPTNKEVDDKEGVVSWDKTVNSKEPVIIEYGYSVSYPEDRNINGL